jgi:hypothetical protein
MQDLRTSNHTKEKNTGTTDRRRDILFLSVLVPISLACLGAFFISGEMLAGASRTIFLLGPIILAGVWLAYEQMHDLVWWNMHPLCPTCRRSFNIAERPKPGMICDCCDQPLYPLRTPQDYKVIVLITTITVIALPVFMVWTSLVTRLS